MNKIIEQQAISLNSSDDGEPRAKTAGRFSLVKPKTEGDQWFKNKENMDRLNPQAVQIRIR